MMIEMDMLGRYNTGVIIMLNVQNLVDQFSQVMIINKRDGACYFFIVSPFLFDQVIPDQVANCLGTVCIFLFLDMPVELSQ